VTIPGPVTSPPTLALVLDEAPGRLAATAASLRALLPGATIIVLDAATALERGTAPDAAAAADVVLVRAEPGSWAAACVLAAYRPPRFSRPVRAFLVAEGPLETFSTLITDFPTLRLLPPDSALAATVAGMMSGAGAPCQV
jgi:hypothetical protein